MEEKRYCVRSMNQRPVSEMGSAFYMQKVGTSRRRKCGMLIEIQRLITYKIFMQTTNMNVQDKC